MDDSGRKGGGDQAGTVLVPATGEGTESHPGVTVREAEGTDVRYSFWDRDPEAPPVVQAKVRFTRKLRKADAVSKAFEDA